MLSDESSSDSETGRFKCRTKKEDEPRKSSNKEDLRPLGRSRPSGTDRFHRDVNKKIDEREHYDRRSRERHGYSRQSPVRRRHSRDRSPYRRSRERDRPRPQVESQPRSRPREQARERSGSKDGKRHSRSRSHRSPEQRRDLKEELRRHIKEEVRSADHKRDLKEELRRHIKEDVRPAEHKRDLKEELRRHIKEDVRPAEHKRDLKEELRRHIKEDVRPAEHKRDLKEELRRHIKEDVRPAEHKRDLKEELKRHIKEDVRPAEYKRDLKEELRRHVKEDVKATDHGRDLENKLKRKEDVKPILDKKREPRHHLKEDLKLELSKEKRTDKFDRRSRNESSSPDYKSKRSVVQKPTTSQKQRSRSPVVVDEHDSGTSEEVQLGSYYSLIPAVVKEKGDVSPKPVSVKDKSEESSEIDSSDDERLRAKLLNLEKELHKTRKKKHKKKHKKKSSKSSKDKEPDPPTVEVSSTTDIDKADVSNPQPESAEVSSTQKISQKESSEEGEITSDDDSKQDYDIDPTDLRHKLKKSTKKPSQDQVSSKTEACGPALPPHLQKRYKRSISPEIEGPALPSNLKSHSKSIGPSIPDDLRKVLAEREQDDVKYVSSDEDVGIGPLPVGTEEKWSDAHKRLEERALDMKIRKLDGHSHQKSDVKSREQWMLELPEAKAKILGLEARSFRAKAGPDMSDRSSWTDTPVEKAQKAAGVEKEEDAEEVLQREANARHIASRDEDQEKAVKKHKKKHKRDESLLEMHEKKLKKKKKKDEKEGKPERRPFSRDVDLQVNRFDEAQKRSIIKKAQDLDSRFGRGEAKFL